MNSKKNMRNINWLTENTKRIKQLVVEFLQQKHIRCDGLPSNFRNDVANPITRLTSITTATKPRINNITTLISFDQGKCL